MISYIPQQNKFFFFQRVNKGLLLWPVGIGLQAEHTKDMADCGSLFAKAICRIKCQTKTLPAFELA